MLVLASSSPVKEEIEVKSSAPRLMGSNKSVKSSTSFIESEKSTSMKVKKSIAMAKIARLK